MIQTRVFRSESGLRPMSAFVVVGFVLLSVAARVAQVALEEGDANVVVSVEHGLDPAFELIDTHGRGVARFVERLDLVASPRSMWLAHTPDYMAGRLAEVADCSAAEVLARMLPDVDEGWIEVTGLPLTPRQATAVIDWAERGATLNAADRDTPLAGFDVTAVQTVGDMPRFNMRWQPAVVLARSEREAHGEPAPTRWTRRLLDGLALALYGDPSSDEELDRDANEACRRQLWARMMPTGHCIAIRDVPAELALEVEQVLAAEGVSPLQARLTLGRDRRYAAGELEVFGTWGRVAGDEPEPLPRDGLELVADKAYAGQVWSQVNASPAAYAFRVHRNRNLGRTQYYLGRREAVAAPRVVTTLDLDLLRAMRGVLVGVMQEHEPALAMAIALDLQSGDVLAVDSLEKYPVQPFAPVYYAFTPGSTFKMVTMATALEEGVVRPDDRFDVGQGEYRLKGSRRVIREAEGSRTGVVTATEAFAYSVNAGLVQIGQRVDPERFRARIKQLGYATYPGAGLGSESAGYLPALPWKANWTQASVSFGHELMTTLWQHAAALAAIARGGSWRELRLIEAVEVPGRPGQGLQRVDLPRRPARRVFSSETSRTVREMMAVGASVGTGRDIVRSDVVMGTKTGTAEKVDSEVCAHVAGAARAAAVAAGERFTEADYAALRHAPRPHARGCYTSSMCIVGRPVEGGREVMVLVVVDEPTGRQKFGSKVAGPAAANIFAEALGRTRDGAETMPVTEYGFALAQGGPVNEHIEPWRLR